MKIGDADIRTSMFQRDIEMARRVHVDTLPKPFEDESLEFGLAYQHAVGFGGDHAFLAKRKDGTRFLAVTDVTGHGVAAAMMVGRISTFIAAAHMAAPSPRTVLESLNEFISGHFGALGMFATAVALAYDPRTRRARICGAGHPPVLHVRDGAAPVHVASRLPLLGIEGVPLPDEGEDTIQLAAGDLLIAYTDGLFEARNAEGRFLGFDGVHQELATLKSKPAREIADGLAARARVHTGRPLVDDVLVAVLRVR